MMARPENGPRPLFSLAVATVLGCAHQTAPNADEGKQYLYRGIAGRNFERRFQLADHVKVTGAKLANGLLTIELQREIPEEKKPRAIEIKAEAAKPALTH